MSPSQHGSGPPGGGLPLRPGVPGGDHDILEQRAGREGDLEMESEAAGAIAEMLVGADVKGQRSHGLVR